MTLKWYICFLKLKKMSQNAGSIFLSIIFVLFLSGPTIISMVDDSVDISIFYSISEEEEKGSEITKTFEVLFNKSTNNVSNFFFKERVHNQGYFFKEYRKPHLNLVSPPPERHIL